MKLLICPHCKSETIGPPSENWARGGPVMMGRWIGSSEPIVFKCHSCTSAFKLTAPGFHRLPEMPAAQLAKFAPSTHLAVD